MAAEARKHAPAAQPDPRKGKPWRIVITPPKHRRRRPLPNLLQCALILLDDGCPPERCMMLCRMQEDDDGETCRRCWSNYLYYVVNGRVLDPYRYDRLHEGGLKP